MASKTETRKIEIVADAKKADASIKDMRAGVALLNNQLNKLPVTSQEFADKSKELKDVRARLKGVQTEAKQVEGAFGGVLDQMIAMTPFSGQLQMMKDRMGGVKGGVQGLSGGFKTLKMAIAATGIGLLLTGLATLYTYLTSTQEGMDKLTAVTRPLQAIFDKLIGVVQNLGGSVFKGLSQILNGDIKDGLASLKEGAVGAVGGISEAVTEGYKAGTQLDQLQKTIEKTEIELIKNRARLNEEYQIAKEIAQDQSRSEHERLKAAKAAQVAQNQLLEMEQGFLDLKIEKTELSHSLNDTSREDEKELAQLVADRASFEADAAKKRASAKNLENTISKQSAQQEQKILDERRKAEEAHQRELLAARQRLASATQSLNTQMEDLQLEAMEEGLEKELATLDLKHRRELEALEAQKDEVLSNMAVTEEEKIELLAMFREQQEIRQEEYEEARKEKEAEDREERMEEELELLDQEEEMRRLKMEEHYLQTEATDQERRMAELNLEQQFVQQRLALLQQAGQGQTMEAQKLKNQLLKINQERITAIQEQEAMNLQQIKDKWNERLASANALASGLVELSSIVAENRTMDIDKQIAALKAQENGEEENAARIEQLEEQKAEIQRKAAKKRQALEIAQVIQAGIAEIAQIWSKVMTLGPIAGPILGAILTGVAVGRTALNVRKIRQQSYASGGFTEALQVSGSGKLVDNTGHAVAGVVHEKEWVAPRWMTESPRHANVIGWLESERTRRFAEGGYTNPAASSNSASIAAPDVGAMQERLAMLQQDFRTYAARVDNWAQQLQVHNDVRDTRDALQTLNRIDEQSSIR